VPAETVALLPSLGLSSICNVLAAIKTARYLRLTEKDVIITVATDDATMYGTEREKATARDFGDGFGFDAVSAGETFARHLAGQTTEHLLELTESDRHRIFNLGYFTWVEQQGVPLAEFEARRRQTFWKGLRAVVPVWDAMIDEFNGRTAKRS
jgi:cysteine synthase